MKNWLSLNGCWLMNCLTNSRDGNRSAKITADHRQTGRAAIHFVDLFYVRETTDLFAVFDKAAVVGCKWTKLDGRLTLVQLSLTHLLGRLGVGGQNLLCEIQRQPRGLLISVPGDPFFDSVFEFRELGIELTEGSFVYPDQAAFGYRFDGGATRLIPGD